MRNKVENYAVSGMCIGLAIGILTAVLLDCGILFIPMGLAIGTFIGYIDGMKKTKRMSLKWFWILPFICPFLFMEIADLLIKDEMIVANIQLSITIFIAVGTVITIIVVAIKNELEKNAANIKEKEK